jgi:Asp-tRNA(Asn)/Glu-tRNA(Gln) amidotransferase A subunit family amidase
MPGNIEDVAFWPIRNLSELLRTKQVSSVELTKMYLERLHRYNGRLLNTVTFLDDLGMQQAKQADSEIAAGKFRSVLHGIPWGAKDIIAVKGYPTTWGSGSMKNNVFDYDASVIEMVRESGAVLIAKLVSGEFAQGANWFGGQTKNPWNGGSSGGSSAGPGSATSAGCVGFSIGTETSGSILGPSAQCGITGLRPTFGRVSRYGVMALGWTADRLGPMCRYAEDCAMVMSVIAKPDGRDMSVSEIPFNWNPALYDLKKLRIGTLGFDEAAFKANPHNQQVLDTLKSLGVSSFTPITLPTNVPFVDAYSYEQGAFFDEFVRAGHVKEMTNPGRADGFKSARLMNVVDYLQGQRARMMMMTALAKATSGVDVYLVAAGAPNPNPGGGRGGPGGRGAAPARGAAGRGGGGNNHTSMANAACYPAVNVTIGFTEKTENAPVGSPINMVFYAPPFKETELLFVAKSYQDVAKVHTIHPVMTNLL